MTAAAIIKDDVLPVVTAADAVKGPEQGKWTYADYAAIPADGRRSELGEGVLYMSPSAGPKHQVVCGTTHPGPSPTASRWWSKCSQTAGALDAGTINHGAAGPAKSCRTTRHATSPIRTSA